MSPPYPPTFDTKKASQPPTVRYGPGLSADAKQDGKPPGFFFSATRTRTLAMPVFKLT